MLGCAERDADMGHYFVIVIHYTKRDLKGTAKSIDPGQPTQSAQADDGRDFSLLTDFLCV